MLVTTINNNMDKKDSDLIWESYLKEDYQSIDDVDVIPGITCNATDCVYNYDGACAAPGGIEIQRGAEALLEALCMTFKKK